MTEYSEAKTIGFTPYLYCADDPLFHVSAGVSTRNSIGIGIGVRAVVPGQVVRRGCSLRKRHRSPRAGRALSDCDK